jgi:hypothetical protein
VQEGKVNIGAIEQFEIYNTAIIDQYGDSNKASGYKREENSATQTQAGMVILPEYIKTIMNDSDRAIDVTGGFNVSQTQIGNSNESTAFQGVGFFGNNGNIMMLLYDDRR